MRHLEDHGRAPLTGVRIPRTPKSQAVPEIWSEVVSHEKARDEAFAMMLAAVRLKLTMRYELGTSLVVEFRDLHVRDADREALVAFAQCELRPLLTRFKDLYLISDTGSVAVRVECVRM